MSATAVSSADFIEKAEGKGQGSSRRKRCGDRGRYGMAARHGEAASWRPAELIAMILGFVVFWPIGLAVLAWKKNWFGLGDRARGVWGQNVWSQSGRTSDDVALTGNSAFDAYRATELERLEEERRRLIEEEEEFGAFLRRLREAKDQEEFLRFMKDRKRD